MLLLRHNHCISMTSVTFFFSLNRGIKIGYTNPPSKGGVSSYSNRSGKRSWICRTEYYIATIPNTPNTPQNIIIVSAKNRNDINENTLSAFEPYRYEKTPDTSGAITLSDDYAPTDHLVESLVAEIYPYLRAYQQ